MSEAPPLGPLGPFGPYVLEQPIGIGGRAEVFRATHVASGRVVCLKRFLPFGPDDDVTATLLERAHAVMKLAAHPHVVTLLDADVVDGVGYLACELVEEPSLADVVRRRGALPIADVIAVGMALCRGLAHIHDANCVHRHVSPRKLRGAKLDGVGEPPWENQLRSGSMSMGRFRYCAPEQVKALPLDGRADQWAAGVVLWEALTGERLFAFESTFDSLQAIISPHHPIRAPSSLRSGVPPALDDAIMRALSRDPRDRFADMSAFEAAFT